METCLRTITLDLLKFFFSKLLSTVCFEFCFDFFVCFILFSTEKPTLNIKDNQVFLLLLPAKFHIGLNAFSRTVSKPVFSKIKEPHSPYTPWSTGHSDYRPDHPSEKPMVTPLLVWRLAKPLCVLTSPASSREDFSEKKAVRIETLSGPIKTCWFLCSFQFSFCWPLLSLFHVFPNAQVPSSRWCLLPGTLWSKPVHCSQPSPELHFLLQAPQSAVSLFLPGATDVI